MDKKLKEFLKKENVFAVVGVSRDKNKYGYKVYKNLKDNGYKVYPINPNTSKINGEKCYKNLSELPEKPDVVNIVLPPNITKKVIEECKKLGIKKIWMQPGAESKEAIDFCIKNNIEVVYNTCIISKGKRFKS